MYYLKSNVCHFITPISEYYLPQHTFHPFFFSMKLGSLLYAEEAICILNISRLRQNYLRYWICTNIFFLMHEKYYIYHFFFSRLPQDFLFFKAFIAVHLDCSSKWLLCLLFFSLVCSNIKMASVTPSLFAAGADGRIVLQRGWPMCTAHGNTLFSSAYAPCLARHLI